MGVLRLVALALGLALGCSSEGAPTYRPGPRTTCPERMVPVPGGRACIDRHEARIERGRAVPAIDAPAATDLTWFDAERACREADLRLCSVDEFERACAGADRARAYPYGPEHIPRRCNIAEVGDDLSARAVAASGAFPECRTPEGVFDLSGNALEWLADEGRGGGLRALRGGSAFQPAGGARCVRIEAGWLVPEEQAGGFRCCVTMAAPAGPAAP